MGAVRDCAGGQLLVTRRHDGTRLQYSVGNGNVEGVELKDGHVPAADAIVVAVGTERRQSQYFLEHIPCPSQLPSSAAEHGFDFRNPGEGS